MKSITRNLTMHNIKKIREDISNTWVFKGRYIKHMSFYVVRQNPPTSTLSSKPNLRISLSKSLRLQVLTIDL